ncbi:hypothetical protein GCM10022240_14190 [Microbacterium kribbense]|uniref:Uncharacterized protein n=1 Tax=Microbacterium kribbense TaxID=433645 RepID=A0ABP7GJW8_9MICO
MAQHDDDWTQQNEGPYDVISIESISSDEWAREIARRPGMYLGSATFERAVGFIHGLEHPLIVKCRTPEDTAALPTSRHAELLRRNDDLDEAETIRQLEPVLVELFDALKGER